MIKHVWNPSAESGLSDTTDNMPRLRGRVLCGDAELWRIENSASCGWLVTELFPDRLWIWCFQGRGFLPVVRSLATIARSNQLSTLGWFTRHSGPKRLFRHIRPIIERTGEPGEFRYTLNCEDLCALPKTLVEMSPSKRSAVTTSVSAAITARA